MNQAQQNAQANFLRFQDMHATVRGHENYIDRQIAQWDRRIQRANADFGAPLLNDFWPHQQVNYLAHARVDTDLTHAELLHWFDNWRRSPVNQTLGNWTWGVGPSWWPDYKQQLRARYLNQVLNDVFGPIDA